MASFRGGAPAGVIAGAALLRQVHFDPLTRILKGSGQFELLV